MSFSSLITFKTAKAAAHAKWFPPKVVPNNLLLFEAKVRLD
jgi:hypothetical protein